MSYSTIGDFGGQMNTTTTNPLSTCAVSGLSAMFNSTMGSSLTAPNSQQCELFMSQYCANDWNSICEYKSNDTQKSLPNTVARCNSVNGPCLGTGLGNDLTYGQILVGNTAREKYLVKMSNNCHREYQPFDPTNPESPLISKWMPGKANCNSPAGCEGDSCIPVYAVDPSEIDRDPVMNKLLANPSIAMDVLINIYNNARTSGTLKNLAGTKLYRLFMNPNFQEIVNRRIY
jgi:hypothetical protein